LPGDSAPRGAQRTSIIAPDSGACIGSRVFNLFLHERGSLLVDELANITTNYSPLTEQISSGSIPNKPYRCGTARIRVTVEWYFIAASVIRLRSCSSAPDLLLFSIDP